MNNMFTRVDISANNLYHPARNKESKRR